MSSDEKALEDFRKAEMLTMSHNDGGQYDGVVFVAVDDVKKFILKTRQEAREEERFKIYDRVGFLRQWLNEDRITDPKKTVTTKDIIHWLKEEINI